MENNTFKSKKWCLEKSDWKFDGNKAKNITFEENWASWVKKIQINSNK